MTTEVIMDGTTYIEHNEELGFTIVAEIEDYVLSFKCYEMYTIDLNSGQSTRAWQNAESHTSPNYTYSLANAEIYVHGFVKWDGCSNWHFNIQDKSVIHFCGKDDLNKVSALLARCWTISEEECPMFD